jgi:phosphoenolpyruvate synthase/pyruvate phosphate dikinase
VNPFIPLSEISFEDQHRVGGKGYALSRLLRSGVRIPQGICVSTEAYREYVSSTGLHERIMLELNRKNFDDMRWEEIWDTSLRIRNMFLITPISRSSSAELEKMLEQQFDNSAVVVRSSAPGEDTGKTSFAGLHESYVNIRGTQSILKHIKLVWASLWSNRALLYRKELGLDVEHSEMAVVVQEIVSGERSGIIFGQSPLDRSQCVIEAVYGLNQGLVDGSIEPDRWILHREGGEIVSFTPTRRERGVFPTDTGVETRKIPIEDATHPPLAGNEVATLFAVAKELEKIFGKPQDVEWTIRGGEIFVLQSRAITTLRNDKTEGGKLYYLGLQKSFESLKALQKKIEGEYIPRMINEAAELSRRDLFSLSDEELAEEIDHRTTVFTRWVDIYWTHFIPFAHGIRLFGQVYNDTLVPSDPFEFVELLRTTNMESLKRNMLLMEMAEMIRHDPELRNHLSKVSFPELSSRLSGDFLDRLRLFMETYGNVFLQGEQEVISMLLEFARRSPGTTKASKKHPISRHQLEQRFITAFESAQRGFVQELLGLARASYKLRDDDNIHLGRIERRMADAIEEGKRRIGSRGRIDTQGLEGTEIARALRDHGYTPECRKVEKAETVNPGIRARQLRGQPASQGVAAGRARVIRENSELFQFKSGEILVIDAVDPNSTFVAPLAAGIIERRGGMLIHGAIIAREYGIPCITGISSATSVIETGDQVVVDGYLGIVTIEKTLDSH